MYNVYRKLNPRCDNLSILERRVIERFDYAKVNHLTNDLYDIISLVIHRWSEH